MGVQWKLLKADFVRELLQLLSCYVNLLIRSGISMRGLVFLLPMILAPLLSHAATVGDVGGSVRFEQGAFNAGFENSKYKGSDRDIEVCNRDSEENVCVCVDPGRCESESSRTSVGTCDSMSGSGGYQVCCKDTATCGDVVSSYISYFTNPLYPAKERDDLGCNMKVQIRRGICQLRLDFVEFRLPGPGPNGLCTDLNIMAPQSPLSVFGGRANSQLCGLNTGNHMYIRVRAGDAVQLAATLSGTAAVPINRFNLGHSSQTEYIWNIRMTQIECVSDIEYFADLEAPAGCLQWFTDNFGSFKSFNYDGFSLFAPDQNYAICIRNKGNNLSRQSCSITYRAQAFSMPVKSTDIGQCDSGTQVVNADENKLCCVDDESAYLAFVAKQPAAAGGDGLSRRYWCGGALGSPSNQVTSFQKPFIVKVFSPNVRDWSDNVSPVGFSIDYKVDTGIC